jgi:hypothetical protein
MKAMCSGLVVGLLLLLTACGSQPIMGGAPAAPTLVSVNVLAGGAHAVWSDNSDNETEFMVMRREGGSGAFAMIASVPFDTEQYHDTSVASGRTYTYMVMAVNDDGETESNELEFTAP